MNRNCKRHPKFQNAQSASWYDPNILTDIAAGGAGAPVRDSVRFSREVDVICWFVAPFVSGFDSGGGGGGGEEGGICISGHPRPPVGPSARPPRSMLVLEVTSKMGSHPDI